MANLFGMGGGAEIFLTVSQSCGLEMIEMDKNGEIKSYAQAPLEYNEGQREVANYDNFHSAVEDLFAKRNINPAQANIHLSIPTVWFGAKDGIPLLIDDNGIGNIVLGDLMGTYLFKRQEALPYWFDNRVVKSSDSRSIFYTAIQSNAVTQFNSIFSSLGANLASIECSLFATLRGLYVTGVAKEQMDTDASWSLMIITNSGFQLIDMQGKKIAGYYEEAIALKNREGEEVYSDINNAAQIAFMNNASSTLVIVSETDLVSAQLLSEKLQFGGQIISFEDNKFRIEPIMELPLNILAEDKLKVSLHAIGHYTPSGNIGMPVDVNFLGTNGKAAAVNATIETPFGELTPMKATIIVGIIAAILIILTLMGFLATQKLVNDAQATSSELDTRLTQLDEEIAKYNGGAKDSSFNAVNEIEKTLKNNRTKIMAYAALGESIPKNIYLTYFLTLDDGKINIKGCAETVEDVYVFFKNVKDSLVDSSLRIGKLDLKEGSLDKIVNNTSSTVDDAPYVFEITNMTEDEMQTFKDTLLNRETVEEKSENPDENKSNEEG